MTGDIIFRNGINLKPSTTTPSIKGDIVSDSSSGNLKYHNGTTSQTVQTDTNTSTLTNKTINGPDNTLTNIADTSLSTISTAGKVSNSATTASSSAGNSTIVARDSSGNFSAGTITASLTGNVTGNLTGNVTGNVTGNTSGTSLNVTGIVTSTHGGTGQDFSASTGAISVASGTMSAGTLSIANGGTGQVTANAALNALLPSQTGNNGKLLSTNGTSSSWTTAATGTVTSVALVMPPEFSVASSPITTSGTLTVTRTLTTQSKTGTYIILNTDDVIKVDASGGAFTLTLPSASSNPGKKYVIIRTETTFANAVTLSRAGSDTIGISAATSVTLNTIGETYEIVSDGTSNWIVVNHKTSTPWISFTPSGSWVSNTTYTGFWRRNGDSFQARMRAKTSGAPTSAGLTFTIPITMDTTKLTNTGEDIHLGSGLVRDSATASYTSISLLFSSSTQIGLDVGGINTFSGTQYIKDLSNVTQAVPMTFGNNDYAEVVTDMLPVSGWLD